MKELIDVFRMDEVTIDTRIKLIKELARLINYKYASNVCNELADELMYALEEKRKKGVKV